MSRGRHLLSDGALAFAATELAFLALYAALVLLAPSHATLVRLSGVVGLLVTTYMLQQAFFQWCDNPHWRGFAAAGFPVQLMNASDIIFIARLSSTAIPGKSIIHQAYQALVLLFNQRRIGTVWQAKNVPPAAALTRTQFLRERLTTTALAYLALDAMISGPAAPPHLVAPEKQTLTHLASLTRDDLLFRTTGSLLCWLNGFLLLVIVSNTVAIALVTAGLSTPADRPPLFGALPDAYSVRACWGRVWHQCLRRGLVAHADFVADRVLRIPRGSLVSRYARLFGVFFLSGVVHHVCVQGMGVPAEQSGALVFFSLQALGIMVEDAAQAVLGGRGVFKSEGVRRCVGYAWVVAFVAWSTPMWFYPQARTGSDAERALPVRVARPLVAALKGFVRA